MLDDDRAEPHDRVERDHVLRAVGQGERDPVAGLDPQLAQSTGSTPDLFAELGVGRRRAEELERRLLAVFLHRGVEHVDEGLGDGCDVGRHTLRIGRDPGATLGCFCVLHVVIPHSVRTGTRQRSSLTLRAARTSLDGNTVAS